MKDWKREVVTDSITAMREDIEKDQQVIRVKTRIVALLAALPDDDSRRRVIAAMAILLGVKEP